MREINDFCDLRERASRLANPFGHPSQVRTQVLILDSCIELRRLSSPHASSGFANLRRLASPFGEGLTLPSPHFNGSLF